MGKRTEVKENRQRGNRLVPVLRPYVPSAPNFALNPFASVLSPITHDLSPSTYPEMVAFLKTVSKFGRTVIPETLFECPTVKSLL
jgi:hypothetical protein